MADIECEQVEVDEEEEYGEEALEQTELEWLIFNSLFIFRYL
jgi:hypothetical protein